MPIVGYNPYDDLGGAISGGGNVLGGTLLRSAMMRSQQQQYQTEIMLELMKMRQQQEQFRQTKDQQGKEYGLKEKEFGLKEKEADDLRTYRSNEVSNAQTRTEILRKTQGLKEKEAGAKSRLGENLSRFNMPFGPLTQEDTQQSDIQRDVGETATNPLQAAEAIRAFQMLRQGQDPMKRTTGANPVDAFIAHLGGEAAKYALENANPTNSLMQSLGPILQMTNMLSTARPGAPTSTGTSGQPRAFNSEAEANAAGLKPGDEVYIKGIGKVRWN